MVALFGIIWQALRVPAVISTICLYLRSRTLTVNQIQARLALIEEHLRKMSQKD